MKIISIFSILLTLTACSKGIDNMPDKSKMMCADKPNCISTLETRADFSAAPFTLNNPATKIETITQLAEQLKGAKIAVIKENYARIESTSTIFRFVDDLELRIEGSNLIVRSESRTGHSDFGVNKKRVEKLRTILLEQNIISQ
ncbi:DUF1499 domain-containing protein [Aliivibrio sp. S4TY2]|uniref:DUF1499 domain-containing protein n=1 Tax=unclassified Aliivibrio TaxID=2645654 RepID=UPI0023787C2D|nr:MULTISPECIES: DUF1499 domain-containing protein [unclassified Aliivibrio]MDD9155064.1 DUF1499 domain-containing protein [Aliivibrio sp. S4TY2]MDD9158573.1 DUF1499 domain-containing protein [Aliivibrio sp. S4TY1]MDD9163067.1 DUF1499 domain-containing protein [Aliivibrio sp. S4MY2]MDD9166572.1 DUF1499 domain-containing protein [Aliivibrio sp. S4MY4]MDD9184144.1 DUF1499 domain-containing protein [Aliivibrio sp. S4MY3]